MNESTTIELHRKNFFFIFQLSPTAFSYQRFDQPWRRWIAWWRLLFAPQEEADSNQISTQKIQIKALDKMKTSSRSKKVEEYAEKRGPNKHKADARAPSPHTNLASLRQAHNLPSSSLPRNTSWMFLIYISSI
jgi:hypothetical protein